MDFLDLDLDDAFDDDLDLEPEDCCSCLYCGSLNYSQNPNVLCPDCRETFGHAYYSDL